MYQIDFFDNLILIMNAVTSKLFDKWNSTHKKVYDIIFTNTKNELKSVHFKHRCMILSFIKIMIIINNTSADFVLISEDVLLEIIIILIEMRITQLCS